MRRSSLAWLLLGGMGLALCACGDSGSENGLPPANAVYGSGDEPYGNFNDPPGTDNEVPTSFTEGVTCGAEERLRMSDVLLNMSLPLCKFSAKCSEKSSSVSPPVDGTYPQDGVYTRDFSDEFGDIPSFCLELAMSRSGSGLDTDECEYIEALGHIARQLPACEQYITLPRGYCSAMIDRCFDDMMAGGCAAYLAGQYPKSCNGIYGDDEQDVEAQPMPND